MDVTEAAESGGPPASELVEAPVAEAPVAAAAPDEIAAAAVDLARGAALELGGAAVGEHLGVTADGGGLVTHAFAADLAGYRGWYWAVTVSRAAHLAQVTVDEVVLLPGADALRPPPWVPWSERLRAGDLGAGDLLPADPDDPRLVASYVAADDLEASGLDPIAAEAPTGLRQMADEVGLGRARVLSRDGRLDVAQRWFDGDSGPDTPMAKQAPGPCGTCGFMVAVAGSLRAAFGVCANEYSAADGRVVSVEYGCGAHSEAAVEVVSRAALTGEVYDSAELVVEPN